jgi:hypothetical protein
MLNAPPALSAEGGIVEYAVATIHKNWKCWDLFLWLLYWSFQVEPEGFFNDLAHLHFLFP